MSGSRTLAALPKAHLHIHLDGAMRRSTLLELADRAGVVATLPTAYGSFAAFTDTITAAAACLRTPADAQRLVHEIVEDAALAGAVWIEPSMWPGLFGGRLGSDADVLDVVLDAGRAAQDRYGVGFGLIVAANRDRPVQEAVALARLAVRRHDDGVVGFGLDGDETAAPGPLFAEAFTIAREGGLLAVPHAGELTGPSSVRDAMEVLRADRIMHGVAAIADPGLLDRLAPGGVALDVCPTSNVMLSVVPSIAQHPLPALLARGVPCSINADDPLLFDTDLLNEYTLARDHLGLTAAQLATCARTSLRHSGAPRALVESALHGIDAWLQH
ncbi:adenosine deaminase [Dactylosporangium vinaceum]|uniref:Adenosine deaminase n=1 Tax=Dactylosporangium vinaceum TaxID=53362 RepID=A0ABV5MKD2_9ACTN|nr:adenosine deaminase [Dactylosporangium vinaceum]UAB99610.1 adenosine deaminase [Dactylosporangium vinaceum]